MTSILNSAHSGLRWLVLLFLLISIVFAFLNLKKTKIEKPQKLMYLFGLIFTHTQLLIGLVLYFLSAKVVFNEETMSNASSRFYAMEHPLGMLIAIILITMGYSKGKKNQSHKTVLVFYLIGLILIIASIPWPFRTALGVVDWF